MLDSSLLIFIQIVSESFPMSSSGHNALAACVIAYYDVMAAQALQIFFASPSMMLLSHIPTMLIVAIFFRDTWIPLLFRCMRYRRIIIHLILYAALADCITALWYFFLKTYPITIPLSLGFSLTALLLFSLRWCHRERTTMLTSAHMILLGFVQGIALFPGISRFGMVYTMCCWLGIRSTKAFGIAWMLQWPLMLAGAFVGLWYEMPLLGIQQWSFWLYGSVATLIAYGGLYCMYQGARHHFFWIISIYMLIPIIISAIMHC